MANNQWMRRFARWHIWLAWLAGIPILMWTVTGLVMVSRPIEVARGTHLIKPAAELPLPAETNIAVVLPDNADRPVRTVMTTMVRGRPITAITFMDGAIERFGPAGTKLPEIGEVAAREIVAENIVGGQNVTGSTFFPADNSPIELRREIPTWRVELADGAHIFVHQQTGEIAAIRTRWWRVFDTMWGLHIMDLKTRTDTSHPVLILFAALAVIGSLFGCILMFRRRKTGQKGAANAR